VPAHKAFAGPNFRPLYVPPWGIRVSLDKGVLGPLYQIGSIKEQAKERQQSKDMVKIRLMRVGMKGAPSYRVVVADARSPRDGRIIENIGWYNPLTEPSTITIDTERAQHWLNVGAQPTESVRSLLKRAGIVPSTASSSAKS
jgi:small subunit ribosomal protein S16